MVWSLSKGREFLPDVSVAELKRMMDAEKKAKPHMRLLIALHRKKGKSIDDIVGACTVPRRTVHGTLQRFQERGLAAAHSIKQTGRPRRLSLRQLSELRKRLLALPKDSGFRENFWTTRMVITLVEHDYGISYTPQWMWTLLRSMGLSCKKPRPTHYKASPEAAEAFKKRRDGRLNAPKRREEPRFVWTSPAL
jgi:transposase